MFNRSRSDSDGEKEDTATLEDHIFPIVRRRAYSEHSSFNQSLSHVEEEANDLRPTTSPRDLVSERALASPRGIIMGSPARDTREAYLRLKGVLYQLTTSQIRPWNKRWMFLTQDSLTIFKSKENKKPLATIECGSIYRVEQLPHWYKKKEFCMAIRSYGRSYIFSAESQKDLTHWITCIEASIRDCALDGVTFSFQHLLNSFDGDEMKFATVVLEKMQQHVPHWSNFGSFQTDIRRYLQYMQHHFKDNRNHDEEEGRDEVILEEKCEPWQIDFSTLKLGKKIAEGYFGEVYKGTFLQKKVAIKRLKFTQVNDPYEQEKIIHKLKEEAAVMSSLRHPNILLFMGLCSKLPNVCIVTEFADNGSLYDVLQNKVVNDRVFFRMVKDICYGMNYLHNKNILHLDLKPLNLLVDDNLNVKVSDFGISRIMLHNKEEKNTGPTGYGTILYMAPELIYEPITFGYAADVFGFGVLLFELLYLREHPDTNFTIEDSIGYDLVREPVSRDRDPLMPLWWMEIFNGLICECTLSDHTKRPDFEKILKILDTVQDDSEWFMIRHHANQIRRLAKNEANHERLLESKVWETLNKIIEVYSDDVAIYYALCAIIELAIKTEENPAEYLILALDHLERLTNRDNNTSASQNSTTHGSFEECLSKIGRLKYIDMLLNSEHVVIKGKERLLELVLKWVKHEGCAHRMMRQKLVLSLSKLFMNQTPAPLNNLISQIFLQLLNSKIDESQLSQFVDEGGIDTLVALVTKSNSHQSLFTSLQALADLSVRDSKLALVIESKGINPVQMASRAYLGALLKSNVDSGDFPPSPGGSKTIVPRLRSPTTLSRKKSRAMDELQPFMSLTFQRARYQLKSQVAPQQSLKIGPRDVDEEEVLAKLWKILREEQDLSDINTAKIRDMIQQWFNDKMEERKELINSQIQKVIGQMEEPSRITDYLFLGSEWNSANIRELKRLNITHICNVGDECPNYYPKSFTYFNIKLSPTDVDVDIAAHLDTFFNFVEQAIAQQGTVLVHSHLGVSRSACYCIAWMMWKSGWSLQKAFKYIKDKRKIVKPSQEFIRQLIQYDIKLFGQQSLGTHSHLQRTPSSSSITFDDESCESPDNETGTSNFLTTNLFSRMTAHNETIPNTPVTAVNAPEWEDERKV